MRRIGAQQRSEATVAGSVIKRVFAGKPDGAKRTYLKFLAEAIDFLSSRHQDRWGATLFEWGVRLTVGQVECLVLSSQGLRLLVKRTSAPTGIRLRGRHYRYAPGCEMTRVPLSELARVLPSVAKSNSAAMSVAAMRLPRESIRNP